MSFFTKQETIHHEPLSETEFVTIAVMIFVSSIQLQFACFLL